MNIVLWILQVLLGLFFIFAGVMKFRIPVEEMTKQMHVALPGIFLYFIGVCEILGGLGLILPGLFRIKPGLTSLAAAGLVIIMMGAVVIALMGGQIGGALYPLVIGLLLAFIAFARWRSVPLRGK